MPIKLQNNYLFRAIKFQELLVFCSRLYHSLPVLYGVRSNKLLELQPKTDLSTRSSQCLRRRLRELLVRAEAARHGRAMFKVRKGIMVVTTLADRDSSWRSRSRSRKASLPSWHRRPSRNPTLSEQCKAPPPKTTFCAPSEWHSCLELRP